MSDISQININNTTYNFKDTEGRTQVEIMPTASADLLGKIYQFVGTTDVYTNGFFYKCTEPTTGTYEWTRINIQPGGGGSSTQSDWEQTDSTADDYIKNKPTLGTASALDVPASGNASSSQVVKGNDSRLTNSRTPTNHASNKVTSLTGYSKPSSTSAITTSDSLNSALGKLEKGLDGKADNLMTNYSIAALEEAIATTDTKDEAIGKLEKGLQNRAKTVDITDTIQASSWTGASAPYSYTLVITGSGYSITSSMQPIIDVVPSDTVQTGLDQIEQFGYISKAVTGTNTITFYCYEDKPDIDLPISIKLIW